MLIYSVHKSVIVINSIETHLSRNVFEAVQKTRQVGKSWVQHLDTALANTPAVSLNFWWKNKVKFLQ